MGRHREPDYRPHPLLDELRPRLKGSARRQLKKSLIRVGQLHEVLVTADDFILDGRERYELVKELGMVPRVYRLTIHSGVGEMPKGYIQADELEMCREVIEETGRLKWQDSATRRSLPPELAFEAQADQPLVDEAIASLMNGATAGTPVGVRLQQPLREYLIKAAALAPAVRQKCKGHVQSSMSVPEYVRYLCWRDFLANREHTGA